MRSALSWQQVAGLRDEAGGDREANFMAVFDLPGEITAGQVCDRLRDMVAREDSLRVTELSRAGRGELTYAADVELPLRFEQVASVGEMEAIADQMLHHCFARDGGAWWDLALIEYPDESGKPARRVCAGFDHLISDGRSLLAFKDALIAGSPEVGKQRGRFTEWVDWQLRQYPMDAPGLATAASEFWRRYLDGTHPRQGTALPLFRQSAGRRSDLIRTVYGEVPVSASTLRAAAGRLKSSPFLLFLASVAVAIGAAADVSDVTLRVNTSGRPPGYLDTLGCFSDSVPVRIRHRPVGDPRLALDAATSAWLQTLRFSTTPWDYIAEVCGGSGSHPDVGLLPPQVLVNFVPWPVHARWYSGQEPREERGGWLETFQLILLTGQDGSCHLNCIFDPALYVQAEVPGFLTLLGGKLAEVTGLA